MEARGEVGSDTRARFKLAAVPCACVSSPLVPHTQLSMANMAKGIPSNTKIAIAM